MITIRLFRLLIIFIFSILPAFFGVATNAQGRLEPLCKLRLMPVGLPWADESKNYGSFLFDGNTQAYCEPQLSIAILLRKSQWFFGADVNWLSLNSSAIITSNSFTQTAANAYSDQTRRLEFGMHQNRLGLRATWGLSVKRMSVSINLGYYRIRNRFNQPEFSNTEYVSRPYSQEYVLTVEEFKQSNKTQWTPAAELHIDFLVYRSFSLGISYNSFFAWNKSQYDMSFVKSIVTGYSNDPALSTMQQQEFILKGPRGIVSFSLSYLFKRDSN